jgi:hypothetical protein
MRKETEMRVGRVEVKRGSVASPKRGSSRSGAGPTDGPRATDDGLETHTYRDVRALPHEPDPDKRPSDVGTGGRAGRCCRANEGNASCKMWAL